MNLLSEYCKRLKENFVVPTNDGICFFNEHKRPAFICLTSVLPKSVQICHKCHILANSITLDSKTSPEYEKNAMIVELFAPDKDYGYSVENHFHVSPDADVLKEICKIGYYNIEPVYLKHGRDLEVWLWDFFLFHSRLRRSSSWMAWTATQKSETQPLKCYEQMCHCAMMHPKIFNIYYGIYQTLVTGRKYLLFG